MYTAVAFSSRVVTIKAVTSMRLSSLRFFPFETRLYSPSLRKNLQFFKLRASENIMASVSSLPVAVESGKPAESNSYHTIFLGGKSRAENEISESLKRNANLKFPDNEEISILLHSDSDDPLNEGSFQFDLYMNSLRTDLFGRLLLWSPRLSSTHDVVSHNFCDLPVGAVCVSDVQFKGRGRSKNAWESPVGCLMFSFTVQMEDGRIVPLVQYVVSLAITEAIKEISDIHGLPYVDIKIKWPNDLYLNGQKVGGILCTSTYKSNKFNISAGVGLNVDNEKPTTCLNEVLKDLSLSPFKFRREEILATFFNKFEKFFQLLINQGFQSLEELYYKTWLHSGQRIIVQDEKDGQMVENVVTIQGLTSSGYLLAIGDDSQMCELHPDGNSFDFLKGLIRRKLEGR